MNTFTSITYSFNKKDDVDIFKQIEYKSTTLDTNKSMSTYYNNIVTDKEQKESFNKLLKSNNDTYEQIGNSKNKTDWDIKEYHNNILNKEYRDSYNTHNFTKQLLDNFPYLANDSSKLLLNI
jgi:hypothetical protein